MTFATPVSRRSHPDTVVVETPRPRGHWSAVSSATVANRFANSSIAALANCEVLTPDGKHCWRRRGTTNLGSDPMAAARSLGLKLGAEIKTEAGPLYQAHFGDRGW